MRVEYSSNNSGGGWWLDDKDWKALEAAGWEVQWRDRFLGALASHAVVEAGSIDEAIAQWEQITGQCATAEGCPCCGPPHYFHEEWD